MGNAQELMFESDGDDAVPDDAPGGYGTDDDDNVDNDEGNEDDDAYELSTSSSSDSDPDESTIKKLTSTQKTARKSVRQEVASGKLKAQQATTSQPNPKTGGKQAVKPQPQKKKEAQPDQNGTSATTQRVAPKPRNVRKPKQTFFDTIAHGDVNDPEMSPSKLEPTHDASKKRRQPIEQREPNIKKQRVEKAHIEDNGDAVFASLKTCVPTTAAKEVISMPEAKKTLQAVDSPTLGRNRRPMEEREALAGTELPPQAKKVTVRAHEHPKQAQVVAQSSPVKKPVIVQDNEISEPNDLGSASSTNGIDSSNHVAHITSDDLLLNDNHPINVAPTHHEAINISESPQSVQKPCRMTVTNVPAVVGNESKDDALLCSSLRAATYIPATRCNYKLAKGHGFESTVTHSTSDSKQKDKFAPTQTVRSSRADLSGSPLAYQAVARDLDSTGNQYQRSHLVEIGQTVPKAEQSFQKQPENHHSHGINSNEKTLKTQPTPFTEVPQSFPFHPATMTWAEKISQRSQDRIQTQAQERRNGDVPHNKYGLQTIFETPDNFQQEEEHEEIPTYYSSRAEGSSNTANLRHELYRSIDNMVRGSLRHLEHHERKLDRLAEGYAMNGRKLVQKVFDEQDEHLAQAATAYNKYCQKVANMLGDSAKRLEAMSQRASEGQKMDEIYAKRIADDEENIKRAKEILAALD
ncbi:hypothetical protein F5Y16DRAFT_10430 [Xylariaceae sp. FL0255]|nr:hypothetical protein F5Y16DRAFT_10430 [Xylariaceae sp. FL0255]